VKLKQGIFLNSLVILIIAGYLVVAGINYSDNHDAVRCTELNIVVQDSALFGFVTPQIAQRWLEEASLGIRSKRLSEVDLHAIEDFFTGHDYISDVQVYTTMEGEVNIILSQRYPLIRIISETGYDFYADSSFYILPPCEHFIAKVPMVTGQVRFSFPEDFYGNIGEKKEQEDTKMLKKLINFVEIINKDDFLRSLIVQVYVDDRSEIELIPRVGQQVIFLGPLESCQEKLLNLKEFYTQSFSEMWWESARQVDLKYSGQVIVR